MQTMNTFSLISHFTKSLVVVNSDLFMKVPFEELFDFLVCEMWFPDKCQCYGLALVDLTSEMIATAAHEFLSVIDTGKWSYLTCIESILILIYHRSIRINILHRKRLL